MQPPANWISAQYSGSISFIPSGNKSALPGYRRRSLRRWRIVATLAFAWLFMQPLEAQPEARLQSALDSVAPEKPFEVGIGIQVEQIVSVNQKAENFEVVGNLRLIWDDPKLAFESREHDFCCRCVCRRRCYSRGS